MITEPCLATNRARLEAVFDSDAYVDDLGAKLVEWDGGRATFRLATEPRHGNFVGSIHGGALFSLADSALGVACNSWGRICVALTIETQFLSAPLAGEVLVATAVERSRTRRTAAYAIDVVSETDGTLRATFSAMVFRTGRWHLGPDAWSEEWQSAH
jgi:phenylacetic acid degradation protein PaaD